MSERPDARSIELAKQVLNRLGRVGLLNSGFDGIDAAFCTDLIRLIDHRIEQPRPSIQERLADEWKRGLENMRNRP